MLVNGERGARGETVGGLGSEMDSPRRALLRLRILAGPGSLVAEGEDEELEGEGGRLIVAEADSARACCALMVVEKGRN